MQSSKRNFIAKRQLAGPDNKELPEWVKETPEPMEPWPPFSMISQEMEGEFLQDIELTREEYIALKAHLAKLRGYVQPSA